MKLLYYLLSVCTLCFSTVALVQAQTTLIDYGSTWHYSDNGIEPAQQGSLSWKDNNYDVTSWSQGNSQLGYGDGDEVTVLNDAINTAYFHLEFQVADPSIYENIDLNLLYDDGAVVYLNGAEIWRMNMPTGSVNYSTFAASSSSDNAMASQNISNVMNIGGNVLAVEVHQRSISSSDISFDFKLVANPLGAVSLARGPYLQKGAPTSMTLRWRTASATESVVNYGTTLGSLNQTASDLTPKTEHILQINNLSSNSKYYYEVANASTVLVSSSADLYFKTSPNAGAQQSVKAWILGDCGTGNSNARLVRDAFYNYLGSNDLDLILFLGDNAYSDGTDNEYQFGIFENMYENKLKNTVAWSCLGNHDGHSANSSAQSGPYYDIFSFPTQGECGGVASATEAYYSFDYGPIHFISLDSYDSDRGVGGSMYNWCQSDIQNTTADWIVAFWHHPPYSKGSHDSDSESRLEDMRENFLPMLESNGIDLVLSGHSHSYERSYFLNGHYGNSNSFDQGIHTVGANGFGDGRTGGNGAYQKPPSQTDGAVYITGGSSGKTSSASLDHEAMYYSVAELGSCLLDVSGASMQVKFIRETGAVADYFTISKSTLLPIELVEFEVHKIDDGQVKISWETLSEQNNSGFFVERKQGSDPFKSIHWIPADAANTGGHIYVLYDTIESKEVLYYRLLQMDLDGSESYSEMRSVVPEYASDEVNLYPNPVKSNEYLNLSAPVSEGKEITIFDESGLLVHSQYLAAAEINDGFVISKLLLPGFYFVQLTGLKGVKLHKLIVQDGD